MTTSATIDFWDEIPAVITVPIRGTIHIPKHILNGCRAQLVEEGAWGVELELLEGRNSIFERGTHVTVRQREWKEDADL